MATAIASGTAETVATCSICFENLIVATPALRRRNQSNAAKNTPSLSSLSAAPCGHVFHTACVSKWVQQTPAQQQCPQCRRPAETLVRLYLSGEEKRQSDEEEEEEELVRKAEEMLERRRQREVANAVEEEARIFQDVLQCQLSDMERELLSLRATLSTAEEQLSQKVTEISAMEAKMLEMGKMGDVKVEAEVEKRRHLERARRDARASVRKEIDLLERRLRLESDRKLEEVKSQLEEKSERLREAEELIRVLQQQPQFPTSTSNHNGELRLDVSSIYESVEDIAPNAISHNNELNHRNKSQKTECGKVCSCCKWGCFTLLGLTVFLALFVVLPLKIVMAA